MSDEKEIIVRHSFHIDDLRWITHVYHR